MASRFFVTGSGGNNNWGTAGAGSNWSLTDGGAGGQAVPLVTDAVFFTANSPVCTVDTSNRVALSLDFTGYNKTITMTFGITVSGSITLVSAMTISGSGFLAAAATGTLTSNAKTWPNALTLSGTATYTLGDNWTVTGLLTLGGTTLTTTLTANQITCNGGLTQGGTTSLVTGSTLLVMAGSGTITPTNNTSSGFRLSMTFASSGTYTFAALVFQYDTGTMTFTSGAVAATGSTLAISAATTLAVNGINWDKITISGTTTITLNEDLNLTGTLTLGSTTLVTTINGHNINASGGFTQSGTTSIVNGTTALKLIGGGTIAGTNSTGALRLNLTIACSGTYTFSGNTFCYNTGTLTYTSGTVAMNSSATLAITINATTTLACAGITWKNVIISTATLTLNEALNANGLVTVGATSGNTVVNGSDVNCQGGLRFGCTTGSVTLGTSTFNVTNTGTIDASAQTTGNFLAKINLNAPGKTITFAITGGIEMRCVPTRLMYTSGTIVTTSGTWNRGSFSFVSS